jgi:transcriptional regulator with XRE-family HTH domain
MNNQKQNMIATIVKEKRKTLKCTQQELADITKISLRSIQRIEKGEVMPRMHTLKALADCLNFSLDFLDKEETSSDVQKEVLLFRKVVISIFFTLTILLLSAAFIAQSNTFPETDFEFLIYCTSIVGILSIVMLKLWDTKKVSVQDFTTYNN